MAGDSDFKQQVLAATDLVALVQQSVALKRRGKNWVGLCPFHQEKSPSFNVDPVKGYFICFGCKEKGNAIDFVMKRDRLDFLEALKSLGEKAGLEMPKFGVTKQKTSERQALLDIHTKAAEFFHRTLLSPLGNAAREYLTKRGFNSDCLTQFRVGLAPNGWDNLLRSKELAGVNPGLVALGGLAKARGQGGGHYDTFRNRIIFPIRDEQSRVIAFGGRVMPGSDDPAKYLNSPETPLFSKSRAIFGIDLARQRIVESRTVAVVEGYTDVAMAHQFGATNVVSILGTAMTEQHLGILRRFSDRIVLLFDADTAGETAVTRSIELFLSQPVEIAIATLPGGLDPDEFLLKHGLTAFDELLKTAEDAISFKWRTLRREVDLAGDSMIGQQRAVESFLETIAKARSTGPIDPLRWGQILLRVQKHTGIPIEQLQRRFASQRPAAPSRPFPPNRGGPPQASAGADVTTTTPSPSGQAGVQMSEARARAERWILGILLAEPSRWIHVQGEVSPASFADPVRRALAEFYWDRQRNEGEPTFGELLGELPDDGLKQIAIDLLSEAEKLGDPETTLRDALKYFGEERQRQQERTQLSTLVNRRQEDETQAQALRDLFAKVKERTNRGRGPQPEGQ